MTTVHQADAQTDPPTGHREREHGVPPGLVRSMKGANGSWKRARVNAFASGGRLPRQALGGRQQLAHQVLKRAGDIVLSLLGLVLTAPLVAAIAALIRLDSAGPVLFRQTRIGRDGKPFELVKLRTMHHGQGVRATRIGHYLRPMGLDELPQFWNVLIGHMSIVGPRPERPHLVAEYEAKIPGYTDRHLVRPGITGWAQIHGLRGRAGSIPERLKFDLDYVRTWTPLRDLGILAGTLTAVWRDTRRELGSERARSP